MIIWAGLLIAAAAAVIVLVESGVFNDPDGKEDNPEYWEALKEMRRREKNGSDRANH